MTALPPTRWLQRILGARSTSAATPESPVPLPTSVSRDRVGAYLAGRGYTFRFDEDGDITGTWDGNRFWFLLLGTQDEILQIRGRWHRPLPPSGKKAVLQTINDWNRERIWPKAYVRTEPTGLALYTEVSVDFAPGATDDQLHQTLACGLGTAVQLFASVAAMLPPESRDDFDPGGDDAPSD